MYHVDNKMLSLLDYRHYHIYKLLSFALRLLSYNQLPSIYVLLHYMNIYFYVPNSQICHSPILLQFSYSQYINKPIYLKTRHFHHNLYILLLINYQHLCIYNSLFAILFCLYQNQFLQLNYYLHHI